MRPTTKSKPHHKVVHEEECGSLLEFVEQVTKFASSFGSSDKSLCYRGQRDLSWNTEPGLWREKLSGLEENEKFATRELISVHPGEFTGDHSMFEKLVRMQHFGLPTRLLDVTLNPLVALYFATEVANENDADGCVSAFLIPRERAKYYDSDSVSCLSNLANLTADEKDDLRSVYGVYRRHKPNRTEEAKREFNESDACERLLQFIRVEKPHFRPVIVPIDIYKPYFVKPKLSNRRIVAQFGAFIIYGLQRADRIKYVEDIIEYRFSIPSSQNEDIRKSLDLIGINESTLFPELDRAAGIIRKRYSSS